MNPERVAAGMVIDGFLLQERLHKGGMATLWRAQRVGAGAAVQPPLLLKIPILGDNDDPAAIVGFEVEQMILPKLSGIHVPRFIAAGDFTAQPYIAMELLPGESLRARFENAPLEAGEIAAIGTRIATALHDLHRQQVIHLDLKPSNVMFRPSGEAVLVDFGMARHDRLPDLLAEEFRLPLGTAPYMSPEQVLHIRNEPRSDLFALGVLLYHLATGKRPYGNPVTVRGLRRRLYRDPVPPRALRPDLPPWLQEVILHCLEVDAAARYGSGAQLAFDLQHPGGIKLTARSRKTTRDGMRQVARRWFRALGMEAAPSQSASGQLACAPIVMAAIDVTVPVDALDEALRLAIRRVLQAEPDARLACVAVRKTKHIGIDEIVDAEGRNLHVKHLVALKYWARPLAICADKITFHVLEAPDPAAALIDFARINAVDHIVIGVIGAHAGTMLRHYLGSVTAQVVAHAGCTVTVVKYGGNDASEQALQGNPRHPGDPG